MTGLAATVLLQTALMGVGAQSYEEAFKEHENTGKPLLVLVGADWCPGCQVMKNNTMARLESNGKLKNVAFSVINADRDRIAGRLMRGGTIPQLILFTRTEKGWDRQQLTGAQSEETVQSLIAPAVQRHAAAAAAKTATTKTISNEK